ncbi:hypothetical protein Pmani_011363 [Petrolisthes manimaculis]|uniref:Uncharacterized protein n=1 Tax=Petrolisthes manimaculis TaxID=1843537 RepID=A0AAE1PZS2_9EUCA|nr:hypothetical protein Pmani_011363 [Petrolisthes manimaculis]
MPLLSACVCKRTRKGPKISPPLHLLLQADRTDQDRGVTVHSALPPSLPPSPLHALPPSPLHALPPSPLHALPPSPLRALPPSPLHALTSHSPLHALPPSLTTPRPHLAFPTPSARIPHTFTSYSTSYIYRVIFHL